MLGLHCTAACSGFLCRVLHSRPSAQRQPQDVGLTKSKNVELHSWRLHTSLCGCHGAWQPAPSRFILAVCDRLKPRMLGAITSRTSPFGANNKTKQNKTKQADWMASDSKSPISDGSAPSSPVPSLSTASPGNSTRRFRRRATNVYDAVAGLLPPCHASHRTQTYCS